MEILLIIISGLFSGGVASIIVACLQRRWAKQDRDDTRLDALVNAQKITMIDQVKRSAKKYIHVGKITLEEKEHIKEQYDAYKALGGNGHLDTTMTEINRLQVVDE